MAAPGELVRPEGRSGLRRGAGSHRTALRGPAGGQRRRPPRRDGAAGRQELPGSATDPHRAQGRARQEIEHGRRGKRYIFGAFRPATGEAFTETYAGRTTANWVDFLGAVERWIDAGVERVYAVVDNLNVHSATDVLLFALAHPRWEFVFQPKYAAYLNLIEPWWKVLRSLALAGRRFETWDEVAEAIAQATDY